MDFSRLVIESGLHTDQRAVVRLRGELDMACSGELRESLVAASERSQVVVVDLAELTFIDSSGFLALHEAHTAARDGGSRLVLVSPSRAVSRIVELMGFDHLEFTADRSLLEELASADEHA